MLKEKIFLTELQKIQDFTRIYEEYLNNEIERKITLVEFKNSSVLLTLDNKINVIMNTENIKYNVHLLKAILNTITSDSGTIDMTKSNPVYTSDI